ncbi:putative DNA binding domain-containing protein [Chitinophaga oryzae]|uniref:DNA binding domain-containing protein n=1 Tax=Chitinophaga oryzae TaxID=2725414 RepID=A0AAE6ZIF6_9BACT|nr:ATP-binding protein [Chitinophaga oryzae]QJB32487.1 putative DNA binding domain-containing protein [Chitinophaga oryzae]
MLKNWEIRALALLDKSLKPVPSELNELDWKSDISSKGDRLAQHLSAFSNTVGGGFLIYGVNNDGVITGLAKDQIDDIVQKIGNIARNNLAEPVSVDHCVETFDVKSVLIVYIPESTVKPVHLRGKTVYDSFRRSAGQTVKMSATEVKTLIANSQGQTFEEQIAYTDLSADGVLKALDYDAYFTMSGRRLPDDKSSMVSALENEELVALDINDSWSITNMGAILFAKNIDHFKSLSRKAVRVIVYKGINKIEAIKETVGKKGYASGFEGLIAYIMDQLPTNEAINHAIRQEHKMYPEVAIREFVANALIHQDFSIAGTSVMVEVYSDRMEITNPGVPLIDVNRFIDTAPRSRNEALASLLRRLKICEERGSGIDRALASIEAFQLPAPKFERAEDYTKVTMYAHRQLTKMDKEDRIRACYQHCCLLYVSNEIMTNQTVRRRFDIAESNYPMASRIISETIEANMVKPTDPGSNSRRHSTYIPYWA